MRTTHETVTAFYACIENKDFDGLRRVLHDELRVCDPIEPVKNADEFVSRLTKLAAVTEGFRVKHLFVDGERACCVYDLLTSTPLKASPATEYFELREGRISRIEAHYDARPWMALFGKEAR